MKVAILLVAVLGIAAAHQVIGLANVEPEVLQAFQKWTEKHNRVYLTSQESMYRLRVFRDNFFRVKAIQDKGEQGFTVGLNKFADLTKEEFRARYTGTRVNRSASKNTVTLETGNAPTSVDWRTKGAVTDIKDQGMCGSCWAFSATGSLEGVNAIKNGKLLSFSEQQIVDCSWDYGNEGCNGGLMDQAFDYVKDKGVELETDIPYKGVDGKCKYDAKKVAFKISSYTDVPENQQTQLEAAVVNQPVSVAIEADQDVFQFYTGGVITSDDCGTDLDHGVLAVGYDNTQSQAFWIVKNSWGSDWGENGYVRIAKSDKSGPGICGIAEMPSYPVA